MNYTCKFTSTPSAADYNDSISTVPKGATAICTSANCPNLLLTIDVNTQKMVADKGKATTLLQIWPNSTDATELTADCEAAK